MKSDESHGPLPEHPFGSLLRQLRRSRGWTLQQLGRKVYRDASYISRVETGRSACGPEAASRLADALGLVGAERAAFLRLADLDRLLREMGSHEEAWLGASEEAVQLADRLGVQLPDGFDGSHTLRTAARLADGRSSELESSDGRRYVAPRLDSKVIRRLVERYTQPQFFDDVRAMGGDILTEGQNVYPVVYFPAPAGQTPASVLPPTNLDAREGDPILPEEVAVLDPGPRLSRWVAGHPGATNAKADKSTRDGWNLCFRELARTDQGLTLSARLAPYGLILDSCDCLIDEAFGDPGAGEWPLRDRIDAAARNPLLRGDGRAAGIGIAAVMVCVEQYSDGTRRLDALVGRRSTSVGTYPDTWHVVPAGMFNWRFGPKEPNGSPGRPWGAYEADDVLRAVLTEYAEETHGHRKLETNRDREKLDAVAAVKELARVARIEVTGIAIDLANLRPEVCVLLFIHEPGWAARQPWKLNYEYSEHGQPTARKSKKQKAEFTAITVSVAGEALNESARRLLDPEQTVAAGAAAFWLGVGRARELFDELTPTGSG